VCRSLLPTIRSLCSVALGLSLSATQSVPVCAQAVVQLPADPELDVSPESVARAAIAAVNFTAAPGLAGANFHVDEEQGTQRDFVRGSLGGAFDVTIRGRALDAFVGGALGTGKGDSKFLARDSEGEEITFRADRSLVSLRGSGGVSLPITRYLKLQPYASLICAQFDTEFDASGNFDPDALPPVARVILQDHSFDAGGLALTLQMLYDRWWGSKRFEVDASYTGLYTETFNESDPVLEASGWTRTFVALGRWSGATGWVTAGRPWRWNTYGSYTSFPGQEAEILGFDYYFEVGAGLDYEMNSKILGIFGLRMLGLSLGLITGDNVDGYSFGITFQ
jgi:hypothetical protein